MEEKYIKWRMLIAQPLIVEAIPLKYMQSESIDNF
jgi:hypothetical protein